MISRRMERYYFALRIHTLIPFETEITDDRDYKGRRHTPRDARAQNDNRKERRGGGERTGRGATTTVTTRCI